MMNSVGAEKDPYLQAYIQARMKNHVEEVKLQKVLANLEVGRRIKKIMLNMELFEDRKMAHKLKQEASDVETQKKKAIRKYLNSNKMAQFDKLHPDARIFRFTAVPQSPKAPAIMERCRNDTSVLTSSTRRTSVFPVTKGDTINEPLDVKSAPHPHQRTLRQPIGTEHPNGNRVVITVPNSPNRLGEGRRRSTNVRQISNTTTLHSGTEALDVSNLRRQSIKVTSPPIVTHQRPSLVGHLTTPVIHVENVGDTAETERLKTAATVPTLRAKKPMDQRSVRTLPTLLPSHNDNNNNNHSGSVSPSKLNRPKTSSLWPGDPNAIRSVRRDRRKPEEMLSSVKNGEEARRVIRDMPPTCSKNCSKPDILQELGRSYSDLPNLLPAIEKARHAFARQEAASRDIPGDNLNGEDEDKGEETGVMPVSQIQYIALRSMGGVRRNSVIA